MIRFAILAGVSTDPQARKDKLSIPDQIAFCRQKISQFEGVETTEPFVLDGYSRTGYDSLEVAMSEIPPLGAAIAAAQADQYDVLIMDNFDRLGDLAFNVKTRFKKINKQLFSARQSGKLIPPDQYDPYASEDADIEMYVQGIIQTYRINKIRRGWRIGVPERARNGLHPLSVTFGYHARGKDEPAEQIPAEIALIRHMKDWFLSGKTLGDICTLADAYGIKPRRADTWSRQVVKRILRNPYYSGRIEFGRYKLDGDRQRVPVPPSQWVTAPGRHEPVWDEESRLAILAEFERRDGQRARAGTYPLTGLLECSICKLRVYRHGKGWIYVTCPAQPPHITMRYEVALEIVADQVVRSLREYKSRPIDPNGGEAIQREIELQQQLRGRIQEGFESDLYTSIEAHTRIVAVETEIERLLRKKDRVARQAEQQVALLAFADQDLDRLHHWILHDDPTTVNHLLTALCEKIIITPDHELDVVWRS